MSNAWSQLVQVLKYHRQFIREKERAGFEFENIPDFQLDRSLKQKTEREIRKAIREAKKWTAEKLYKHGTYSGKETYGEVIPASEARRARREYRKEQTEYIPDIKVLDWLRDKINALPSVRYFKGGYQLEISPHKDRFNSLLDDIEVNISSKKEQDEVVNYFYSRESELTDAFEVISYDSNLDRVNRAIGKAYVIIVNRPLSKEEAEAFETLSYESQDEFDVKGVADYLRNVMRSPHVRL